jgi:hypothetical protein
MSPSSRVVRWLAIIVAFGMSFIAASDSQAENRGTAAGKAANPSRDSKSADDAKPDDDLADDNSIKDGTSAKGKNQKSGKQKGKRAKPGATGSSGRGRSPRVDVEHSVTSSGGGGGFSSET